MDIGLIKINRENNKLQYSGANRSIYIVRDGSIIELKGDRRPIGETTINYNPFTVLEFDLQEEDIIYSFSDGYYDQFNDLGKKFLKKNLLQLLLKTSTVSLEEQKKLLSLELYKHKGSAPQTDDILVVGIKI